MIKSILVATLGLLTLGVKAQTNKLFLNQKQHLELDSNLRVQVEVLYSIADKTDSIQSQWMLNSDQSVMFRKFDKELKRYSEWIKLDEESPKELIINGSKYYIKQTTNETNK